MDIFLEDCDESESLCRFKFSAQDNRKEVGFLKISYVPSSILSLNPLFFSSSILGFSMSQEEVRGEYFNDHTWEVICLNNLLSTKEEDILNLNKRNNSFLDLKYQCVNKLKKESSKTDRAVVDMIYISDLNYRKTDLSLKLYMIANSFLKKRGVKIYRSINQQRDGIRLWDRFKRLGFVIEENGSEIFIG